MRCFPSQSWIKCDPRFNHGQVRDSTGCMRGPGLHQNHDGTADTPSLLEPVQESQLFTGHGQHGSKFVQQNRCASLRNHTKMGFNGPSIERFSKANLWPPALTLGNPTHPPGSSVCHWSFVKPFSLIWLPSNLAFADYTLLGSRKAPFSNFTWQQITRLLQKE